MGFTTGKAGDIVVLKKNDCNNVHAIKTTDYLIGSAYSAKFTLEEDGGRCRATRRVAPLA